VFAIGLICVQTNFNDHSWYSIADIASTTALVLMKSVPELEFLQPFGT
jgi:hypothetical protein